MPAIDRRVLMRRWLHSHEEDADAAKVYRPDDYPFPPARGRMGFELKPDGSLLEIGIGATDRPTETTGRWTLKGTELSFSGGIAGHRRLRIVTVTRDKLVVRE